MIIFFITTGTTVLISTVFSFFSNSWSSWSLLLWWLSSTSFTRHTDASPYASSCPASYSPYRYWTSSKNVLLQFVFISCVWFGTSSVSDSMSDPLTTGKSLSLSSDKFFRNNCCSFFCRVSHWPDIRHITKSLILLQSVESTAPKVCDSGPLKCKTLKCSATKKYKSFNYTHTRKLHTRKFYFLLHLQLKI